MRKTFLLLFGVVMLSLCVNAVEDTVIREDHVFTVTMDNQTIKINTTDETVLDTSHNNNLQALFTFEDRDDVINISVQSCDLERIETIFFSQNISEMLLTREANFSQLMLDSLEKEILEPLEKNEDLQDQLNICGQEKLVLVEDKGDFETAIGLLEDDVDDLEEDLEESDQLLLFSIITLLGLTIVCIVLTYKFWKGGYS